MASLNFLVHRLLTFPLNKARYEKELKIIKDAAKFNGFQPQHIYKLIRKFNYKKTVKESTTFREDVKASPIVTLPYAPFITKELSDPYQTVEGSDYIPKLDGQGCDDSEIVINVTHADEEHSDSNQNEILHVTPSKTRLRKRRPEFWKDNIAKKLRTADVRSGTGRISSDEAGNKKRCTAIKTDVTLGFIGLLQMFGGTNGMSPASV
ncbi:intraflagellar transport protein 43 [Holotrichia oblita]|uniref:Intraflagellar transport protein 43 n=1 Tax=Holotrichia oblita TaxID=644536 RepID=A0ACB9TB25_HOLOL|nr:intraflagellar transport protein 43 [Holotrichia oblita]